MTILDRAHKLYKENVSGSNFRAWLKHKTWPNVRPEAEREQIHIIHTDGERQGYHSQTGRETRTLLTQREKRGRETWTPFTQSEREIRTSFTQRERDMDTIYAAGKKYKHITRGEAVSPGGWRCSSKICWKTNDKGKKTGVKVEKIDRLVQGMGFSRGCLYPYCPWIHSRRMLGKKEANKEKSA